MDGQMDRMRREQNTDLVFVKEGVNLFSIPFHNEH